MNCSNCIFQLLLHKHIHSRMNYKVFLIILNLLPTVRLQYSELALINQLNNFFHFDHNIFLLDSSIDHDRYINTLPSWKTLTDEYTPQSVYNYEAIEDSNITALESLTEIRSKNTFMIVVPESSKFESNVQLFSYVKSMHRLSINMKIGVFYSDIAAIDDIKKLFEWFGTHSIVNIFCLFYLNNEALPSDPFPNVFRLSPFGAFNVTMVNVSHSECLSNYFPDKSSNFQQYPLRLPIIGNIKIIDYDKKLWKTVLAALNASTTMIQLSSTMDLYGLIDDDIIDVMPHLHIVEEPTNVYPMKMATLVIVVPEALPYSDFLSYLKRITSAQLIGYTVVTIVAVTVLRTISCYIKTKKILLFQCLADVLNLLMNDNSSIMYSQLNRVDVCLIVPLTFAGFVVVSDVISIFQSYVILPVIQPQINTIADLFNSPFPILSPEPWSSQVIGCLENVSRHGGWKDKTLSVGLDVIDQQIAVFNTSISFPSFNSDVKLVIEVQKRLNIRGYHIPTEVYLNKYLASYTVNDNFPFIERLNDIILGIREAGLFDKWLEDHNEMLVMKLWSIYRDDQNRMINDADVDVFPVPAVIFYGWIASVIVFIGEIVSEKIKTAEQRRKQSRNLRREYILVRNAALSNMVRLSSIVAEPNLTFNELKSTDL